MFKTLLHCCLLIEQRCLCLMFHEMHVSGFALTRLAVFSSDNEGSSVAPIQPDVECTEVVPAQPADPSRGNHAFDLFCVPVNHLPRPLILF